MKGSFEALNGFIAPLPTLAVKSDPSSSEAETGSCVILYFVENLYAGSPGNLQEVDTEIAEVGGSQQDHIVVTMQAAEAQTGSEPRLTAIKAASARNVYLFVFDSLTNTLFNVPCCTQLSG